jgi:starch synthase (maltosyl-transferring)
MANTPVPTSWSRVVLVWIKPQVDGGRWPVKRSIGETVDVTAAVTVDGHEKLAVELLFRYEAEKEQQVRLKLKFNDEYVGSFPVDRLGFYSYRIRAWIDRFATWQDQFRRRVDGGESEADLRIELQEGAGLLRRCAEKASGSDRKRLEALATRFERGDVSAGLDQEAALLASRHDPREGAVESETLQVVVDPALARFGAWYEFFPRSAAEPGRHGTLDDAADRLPRIADLGFDIVYLPPIHPIGETFRKGKDNNPAAEPGEPGSPWAIGGKMDDDTLGGHKSVHPELGGMPAFERFVKRADELGLKVALDIAYQTSPDHPYVREHPEWFKHRPDGTIRYAENPPKKYQDVYPFDFESEHWESLWHELKSVFEFWMDRGVTVFRVDNPHTKPFAFWEWCIADLRRQNPEVIFLAEAFSRPKIMHTLAKLGYNQSYTYFTWRNTKQELEEYCTELFQTEIADFYRPNFWPNTPDILHDYLVHGGRPAHIIRFVLAATLSSAYGLYGPPYEHVDNLQHPRREEYANNEKYEVRHWNWNDPESLQPLIKRVNRIRRENPALQYMRNIRFLTTDNPHLLAYAKELEDNLVICVVNLDPFNSQSGFVDIPLEDLRLPDERPFQVYDMLGGGRYLWSGGHNYIQLDPHTQPAHIFRIQRYVRTEKDFDYFA